MLLSLIIPVYKVEQYLKKCLDSCLNQDIPLSEYEIIAVNDGSPDNSFAILKEYESKYPNIKILNQENQGLSMARNNGLEIAKGEYIWFVDSDDWIENNILKDLIKNFESKPDIIQLKYQLTYENRATSGIPTVPFYPFKELSGKDLLRNKQYLPAPAQFCIYRKQFLDQYNLRFVSGILHEDSEFKPRATYFAKKIILYNKVVYNYLQRENGSITSNFKLKNAKDIIFVVKNLIDFSNRNVNESQIKKTFSSLCCLSLNTLLNGYRNISTDEQYEVEELLKNNIYIFKEFKKSNNIKYLFESFMFIFGVKSGLRIHKLLK